ncbi:hypothetical protein EPJ70_08790 [Brachyspira aalborgi]|uniref:Uncharacterized protein n=1 Tax=Brachyspira aalborgi TaxID=29522 RepID=A0A5C8F222_9SPIR|nr:hypothetical protein [Brachyspira aalborgi]TXJ38175.1 hypothetical protein EPJ78_05615 [Brachyspira aalborgi]TXJ44317.1 hypothetical protein EPJ70_08790 [Brachyspira aalborgi]
METTSLMTMMGITITVIGAVATIITIAVGGYALYLQINLSKKTNEEFNNYFYKMLDKVSNNPEVLEKFIQNVIEKEEFKNRFLHLIEIEIENILDSRESNSIANSENNDIIDNEDDENVRVKFKNKE